MVSRNKKNYPLLSRAMILFANSTIFNFGPLRFMPNVNFANYDQAAHYPVP